MPTIKTDHYQETGTQQIRWAHTHNPKNTPVIYVPYWYAEIAKLNKISIADLLNPDNFKRLLSFDDQMMLIFAQDHAHWFDERTDHFRTISPNYVWKRANIEPPVHYSESMRIYIEMLKDRMHGSELEHDSHEPFEVVPSQDALYIIVRPNHLDKTKRSTMTIAKYHQIRALEGILKQLYAYLHRDVVHSTVWYGMYVDLMAESVYSGLSD